MRGQVKLVISGGEVRLGTESGRLGTRQAKVKNAMFAYNARSELGRTMNGIVFFFWPFCGRQGWC